MSVSHDQCCHRVKPTAGWTRPCFSAPTSSAPMSLSCPWMLPREDGDLGRTRGASPEGGLTDFLVRHQKPGFLQHPAGIRAYSCH